jgi:hypothetical protein
LNDWPFNVAVVHAGAGIARMTFRADEINPVNAVAAVFEVAADITDVCQSSDQLAAERPCIAAIQGNQNVR